MARLFAFLRAINAGPGRVVRMSALREVFESLGFPEVATFLGSGNVIFETNAWDIGRLERKIERRLQRTFGYSVPVFIRTHAELREIAALESAFEDRKSTRLNSSHSGESRMPSSA